MDDPQFVPNPNNNSNSNLPVNSSGLQPGTVTTPGGMPNSNTAEPQAAPEQPKKKGKKLLVVAVLVLLLGGAGLAYFLVNNYLKEDVSQSQHEELEEVDLIRLGSLDGPANTLFPNEGIGIYYSQNRQVYEGLIGEVNKKYVPLLAESWTNPDEKTWLFKIKPNVKFHTGKTLTAKDVKLSLDAIKKIEYLGYIHSTLASVEVIGDDQVKVTTTEPDALLLNRLALAYITDQEAADKKGTNGTGPYRLDLEAKYDEKTATFVANDEYHQGRPKTRKLVYRIFDNDAEMNEALKKNEIDSMDTIPDEKAVAGLDEAGFSKIDFEAPGTFGLFLNMRSADSQLKSKEVRNAIALALDRESLVKELDNDNQPATQVVPKSLPGYDASVKFPAFNLDAAKAALKKADPAGNVTLRYLYVEEAQPDPPIIIKQLEAAGFNIEAVKYTEVKPALDKVFAGEFDLFSGAYTSDLADSRDLMGALLESKEQSYPVLNDVKFDALLNDSDKELDPTKRIALLQEANKYVADNLLWIPLRSTVYVSYFKPELSIKEDFNGGGTLGVYFWQVGQKTAN